MAIIREYRHQDVAELAAVWHRSGQAVYTFLPTWQAFSADHAQRVFCEVIAVECDIWVIGSSTQVHGFLALQDSYIDRLYIDPDYWCQGLGGRLLDFARTVHPNGLELHTHVENHRARKFYEKAHFHAVKFGQSPAPESAPDVEYHWRPRHKSGGRG